MLTEEFKSRIYNNIIEQNPVSITTKNRDNQYVAQDFTFTVVRYKDTQPASFPRVILKYGGGSPKEYIGILDVSVQSTFDIIDVNYAAGYAERTITGSNPYEFWIETSEKYADKISIKTEIISGSTSGLQFDIYDINDKLISTKKLLYTDLKSQDYVDISGPITFGREEMVKVVISEYPYGSANNGAIVVIDHLGDPLYRLSLEEETIVRGYFYEEELEIIIQAKYDESGSTHVNGYLIVEEIYRVLNRLAIDWRLFPEADVKKIGKPRIWTDERYITEFIYNMSFTVTFGYIDGVIETDNTPLLKEFTLHDTRII